MSETSTSRASRTSAGRESIHEAPCSARHRTCPRRRDRHRELRCADRASLPQPVPAHPPAKSGPASARAMGRPRSWPPSLSCNARWTTADSPRSICVKTYLARIAAYDDAGPGLNAFIFVDPRAIEHAAALDAERAASGARGPLHGDPIVVKDNIGTADMPTTAGSLALEGFQPTDDAFVVQRLRDAGAVMIGKANLCEFATCWSSWSSLGGQTLDPYDPTRSGRVKRRNGRRGGRCIRFRGARDRYLRICPPASRQYRHLRSATHLRPRVADGRHPVLPDPRRGRADGADRR